MPRRKISFFICFLFLGFTCYAQQNNIWYFGKNAGLDFTSRAGQPIPSVLLNSAMFAEEGCSAVSNTDGELLFYTNGNKIYNRRHQLMLNGDNLAGNISACQSSIIIPMPGNENLFYVFTTDAIQNNFQNGYCYSIVDMLRDNGNGEVISKNILLWPSCTERLTAARHSNGVDIWLITNDNNSNTFRSWLINCSGIAINPVVSTKGTVLDQHSLMNNGYMKVSPDGKQLCQTHFPFFRTEFPDPNFIQLFDFNNATGIISNGKTISSGTATFFDVEFSPDSKLVYLTNPYRKKLYQAECTLASVAAIEASFVTFSTPFSYYGIQIAPDEKIYLINIGTTLGVIANPTIKGTGCQYQDNIISLAPSSGFLGSIAYLNDESFNPANGFSYSIMDSCSGKVQFKGFSNLPASVSWLWDFGDGTTSTISNPQHTFTPSKQGYIIKLKINSSIGCGIPIKISKRIVPAGISNVIAFDYFGGCDSGYIRLVNKNPLPPGSIGQYIWDFGDGTTSTVAEPNHVYTRPAIYSVKLKYKNNNPCLDDSLSKIINMKTITGGVSISADQTIFSGQTVQLFAKGPGSNFQWTPATGLNNPFIARPLASPTRDIVYKVSISTTGICNAEDSVRIKVVELNDIYMPTGFTPNSDGKNDLIRPVLGEKFVLKEFTIYNRWGQRIFATSQQNKGWNGKIAGLEQDSGVYIWTLHAIDTRTDKRVDKKGTFILLR